MEISIAILNQKVYDDVYIVTGQTGKGLGNVDGVSATEDEDIVLEPFLAEATAELAEVVSTYGTIAYGDGQTNLTFSLPSNWKVSVQPALEKALHNYLVNSVCVRWFATTNRDDMQFYIHKIESNTTNIIKLLCEKTKPKRTQ